MILSTSELPVLTIVMLKSPSFRRLRLLPILFIGLNVLRITWIVMPKSIDIVNSDAIRRIG
jgi:hypothetical protein